MQLDPDRTPHSQLAVPVLGGRRLLGVLFVESEQDLRFGYDDEDALATVAAQLGLMIHQLQQSAQAPDETIAHDADDAVSGPPLGIRHYGVDDSLFIDQDYLIKGVAGAIFWKLLRDHQRDGRVDFTNRELRLDPAIRLPEISENLEARLVLLERRLVERSPFLRIEKTGRGRFRLVVRRPLKLLEMTDGTAA